MELVPKLWSLKFRKFRIQTWSNLVQVPPVRLSLFRQSIILQSIKLDNFWSAQRAALEGLTHRQMKSPHITSENCILSGCEQLGIRLIVNEERPRSTEMSFLFFN